MADSNHEVLIHRKSVPVSIPSDDGSVISKVVSSCSNRSVSLFDVNQLLAILKNILPGAQPNPQPVNVDTTMLEAIRKISKLAYNFSTSNKEETLEQILHDDYLSKYGWDVTMVTVLASFATNYAAFRVQSFMQASAVKLVVEIDKGMVATVEMIEQALKLMNLRKEYKVQVSTSSSSVDYVTQAICNTFHIVVAGSSLVTGTKTNSEALTSFTTTTAQIKTTVQALSSEIKTTTEKGQIHKVVSKKISVYEAISEVVSIRGTRSVGLFDVNKLLPIVRNTLPNAYANPESVNVDTTMVEAIRKLSSKLPSDSLTVSNVEEILQEIHSNAYLAKYGWDVMMVTVLASFGTKYAAFRMQSFMQAFAQKVVVEIDKGLVATVEMIENALKLMNLRKEYKVQVSTSSSSVDYVTQAVCNTIHIVVMGSSLVTGFETNNEALTSFTTITSRIKTVVRALSVEVEATTRKVQIQKVISTKKSIYEAISKVVSIRGSRSVRLFDVNKLLPNVRNSLPSAYAKPEHVKVDAAMLETIRKLSSMLPSNCSTISNVEDILGEILYNEYLSKYGWDVTMVTVLASFGTKYATFREQSSVKKEVVEIDKGMMGTVKMVENALELMNLRKNNKVQASVSSGSVDYISQAVCNTIHIVVTGSSLVTGTVANNEALTSFTTITSKIRTIIPALSSEIRTITEKVDWQTLEDVFCKTDKPSIGAMLHALFKPDPEGLSELVTCNKKEKVSIEQIKGDDINLVITGTFSSKVEVLYFAELMKKWTKCQLVFIPMSYHAEGLHRGQPPIDWYTVRSRSVIRTAAIKFIEEKWAFKQSTIVVPLGQKDPKSFPIDWICTKGYFPTVSVPPIPPTEFSYYYLIYDIYRLMSPSYTSYPFICLYGGDLIGIEDFIKDWSRYRNLCKSKYRIDLEFVYISRREDDENINKIKKANFGYTWEVTSMEYWCFWSRVQSFSREYSQLGPKPVNDASTLLGCKYKRQDWVALGAYGFDVPLIFSESHQARNSMESLTNQMEIIRGSRFYETLKAFFSPQGFPSKWNF